MLTGAADHETGMLSGLNTTGHEIGGSLGIAMLADDRRRRRRRRRRGAPVADGIGDAFLVAAVIAGGGERSRCALLPSARTFLPKLALAPRVAVH